MAFQKGRSGNPAGKPKGAQNKLNLRLKELIGKFLDKEFATIKRDFKKLSYKDRAKLYTELLQYHLPKQKFVVEMEVDQQEFYLPPIIFTREDSSTEKAKRALDQSIKRDEIKDQTE